MYVILHVITKIAIFSSPQDRVYHIKYATSWQFYLIANFLDHTALLAAADLFLLACVL